MKSYLYPIMTVITMVLMLSTFIVLSWGIGNTKDEVLKSRQGNVEGRAQVIKTIKDVCQR